MQKPPLNEIQYLQFQNNEQSNVSNQLSPQSQIQKSQKQYFYIKLTFAVILVILSTLSTQTQMQYYAPFVRTVQCFFNYHLLQHDSQDLYEGGTVIYYRTQQYKLRPNIFNFFTKYLDTMDTFHNNSFFYMQNGQKEQFKPQQAQMVKILIIYEANQNDKQLTAYQKKIFNKFNTTKSTKTYSRIISTVKQKQWILTQPLSQLRDFFQSTVFTQQFYQRKVKRIELATNLDIKFKEGNNCSVQVKTIGLFYSSMMMSVKVETVIYKDDSDITLAKGQAPNQLSNLSNSSNSNEKSNQNQYNQENLGMRKLSQFHNMNLNFQYMGYVIFVVNGVLFCVQLMVIIRTNKKIQQNLKQEKQFQKQIDQFNFNQDLERKRKLSDKWKENDKPSPQYSANLMHQHQKIQIEKMPIKMSYKQRLDIIGLYNVIQLSLSFLVLITVNSRGLVCLFCWAKMSLYLSETGNKLMLGFLFKKAIPAYLNILANLSIWLTGCVFFSMVTYRITKKFQSVQLSYYEYIFNYFQYGIFENFRPIRKYGDFYSFLYFIQMAFLVMLGNNILQSILAQQVLKNSNMQQLTELIQNIEVQCPVCGCPPQVKKKIKVKLPKKSFRQNQFISRYFQSQKQLVDKSKYEIKILSPQFLPMFHKSQYKKKQQKLRKHSKNMMISIVGQQSILDSPPVSPISPYYSYSPNSPLYSPITSPGRRAEIQQHRKKVLFEIGGQVQEKSMKKIVQFQKKIKSKFQILNKIIFQLSRNTTKSQIADPHPISKHIQIQLLKKKLEQVKKLTEKTRQVA